MKKKILAVIFGLALSFGMVATGGVGILGLGGEAFAAEGIVENYDVSCSEESEFLGLRPWYYGLTVKINGKCEIGQPSKAGGEEEKAVALARFIWQIVLNVLIDLFVIAGMVAVGFLIYGGYLYLRSGGDPAFAAKGRKTLTAALVGLIISVLANVIMRVITVVLETAGGAPNDVNASVKIVEILNWVYAIMGIVAVAGIIFGAIVWTTSQGDPGKIKKGRDAVLYAVIGLFIVLTAVAITNLVIQAPESGNGTTETTNNTGETGE